MRLQYYNMKTAPKSASRVNGASIERRNGSRLLFLFAPVFEDRSLLTARRAKEFSGDVEISDLATGMGNTYRKMMQRADTVGLGPVDHLGQLEQQRTPNTGSAV